MLIHFMYAPAVAPDVTAALNDLAESELDLQKALGDETMLAMWTDPYFPPMLKRTTEHLADLHETRLKAEDAMNISMRRCHVAATR